MNHIDGLKNFVCILNKDKEQQNQEESNIFFVDVVRPILDYQVDLSLKLKVNWAGHLPSYEDNSSVKEDLFQMYTKIIYIESCWTWREIFLKNRVSLVLFPGLIK